MRSSSYAFSTLLHISIIALLWMDWSFVMTDFEKTSTPVIMVDLKKVQIGELTNLPPKVSQKKNTPSAKTPVPPKTPDPVVNKTPATQIREIKTPAPVKPREEPAPKNAAKAIEPPKPAQKKEAVKKPSKQPPKNTPAQKSAGGDLKSLLASVDKIKKTSKPASVAGTSKGAASGGASTLPTGQEVQDGIEGGTGGSLMQPLTISEKDLIVTQLRGCWNVDAGASGIDEMVIEVRARVGRDGRVKDVKIMNMKNDPSFRSVAESAQRAIYICDMKGDESPFKMLADTRSESYDSWKEIFVRFRPLDGGVF